MKMYGVQLFHTLHVYLEESNQNHTNCEDIQLRPKTLVRKGLTTTIIILILTKLINDDNISRYKNFFSKNSRNGSNGWD